MGDQSPCSPRVSDMSEICIRGDVRLSDVEEALRMYYGSRRTIRLDTTTSTADSDRSSGTITSGATDSEYSGRDDIFLVYGSSSRKASAEINELQNLLDKISTKLDEKEAECAELVDAKQKALATVQTFHLQQKQLFDEFQLLRQRYDEQRDTLQDILWLQCGPNHPNLKAIPALVSAEFIETPDQVGDFSIGDVLGEGQFATVFNCKRGQQVVGNSGKALALKVIKKDKITTFNSLKHVSNEIEILTQLNCDFIVRIEEIIQTASKLYIITEKGGRDLFEFFDEHPDGVSEEWAREIMSCILQGVMYIHKQGICHRDLKPENILIAFDKASGKCASLKLCDFGLASRFEVGTYLDDFCGSPGFFAPEMVIRGTYYGDKADIWSCGCILLELTLGHERFCDTWMCAYDYEVLQDKAVFAKEIRLCIERLVDGLSFSDELNQLIAKFLRLRSSLRPPISEVCSDVWLGDKRILEAENEDESVPGPPLGTPTPNANRHSLYGIEDAVGNTEVDPEIIHKSFSSLSERERHLYEEHNKQRHTDDSKLLHLPPIEPPTPNMTAARKILKKGDVLVQHAHGGGGGAPSPSRWGSPGSSDGPGSPDKFSTPLTPQYMQQTGSPGRLVSALPLLSEAALEKDEDDGGYFEPRKVSSEKMHHHSAPAIAGARKKSSESTVGEGGMRRKSSDKGAVVPMDPNRRHSNSLAAQSAAAVAAALAEQVETDSNKESQMADYKAAGTSKLRIDTEAVGQVVFTPRSPRFEPVIDAKATS